METYNVMVINFINANVDNFYQSQYEIKLRSGKNFLVNVKIVYYKQFLQDSLSRHDFDGFILHLGNPNEEECDALTNIIDSFDEYSKKYIAMQSVAELFPSAAKSMSVFLGYKKLMRSHFNTPGKLFMMEKLYDDCVCKVLFIGLLGYNY